MVEIRGYVARVVSDDELIINKGADDGVKLNMIFYVVDERTRNVKDPVTGADLGSVERGKAQAFVTDVGARLSVAKAFGRSNVFGGFLIGASKPRSILTSEGWQEGVAVSDEVVHLGMFRKTD